MSKSDLNAASGESEASTETDSPEAPRRGGMSRRALLFGGGLAAAAGIGAATAVGVDSAAANALSDARSQGLAEGASANGSRTIPFYGRHQAGIDMHPQTHQALVALNLLPGTDRDAVRRLLTILTDDAARMTQGTYALADSEPEMALLPAGLTVTFGFGRGLVDIVSPADRPDWLDDLPPFQTDRLRPEWNGGDLLLQIAADDPITVAHTQRMLLKDARGFATIAWVQSGFRRAYGTDGPGRTQRNLLGQVDGTVNPSPETDDFASVVWNGPVANPAWLDGGTGMVVRRFEMLLDKWDRLDRSGREQSVGRRMSSGAPLTGSAEHDEPDFEAKTPLGFPVIAEFAHIRRARSEDPHERMFRRGYNYDMEPTGEAVSDSGFIFTSFQYNVATQFTPVQRRLDELDLLNEWITPIGSAVFAMPPGCQQGGFVGETLFA